MRGSSNPRRTVGLDATAFAVIARWMDTRKAMGLNGRGRTHKAVVTIGFDDTNFWITYADSRNLGYKPDKHVQHAGDWIAGPVIHGNCNLWVEQLAQSIAASVKNPPKSNSSVVVPCDSVLLIADELEKLDALRARGVLTQEEFDQQKAKLLAR